ncbi:MAG: hypothetical protein JWO38_4905 [Gemmataceae bacterium]|nr:hypothetical protein [Gemmataceae bacterium]
MYPIVLTEEDRGLILLALAYLGLLRPGFADAARRVSEQLDGEFVYDSFRACNDDIVKPIDDYPPPAKGGA